MDLHTGAACPMGEVHLMEAHLMEVVHLMEVAQLTEVALHMEEGEEAEAEATMEETDTVTEPKLFMHLFELWLF